jgi:hypothetical protein
MRGHFALLLADPGNGVFFVLSVRALRWNDTSGELFAYMDACGGGLRIRFLKFDFQNSIFTITDDCFCRLAVATG